MASHSLPIPLPQVRDQAQANAAKYIFPLRAASVVFVALLVLLLWLHFGLSLQITKTERRILNQRLLLEKLQRDNAAIRLKIAEAESPQILEERALEQNYRWQQPLYLTLSQSSPERTADGDLEDSSLPNPVTMAEAVAPMDHSPMQRLLGEVGAWLETKSVP